MIGELDPVILTTDQPELVLRCGDMGTVVLVHGAGAGYEGEVVALDGAMIAVTSLSVAQVRAARAGEIAHARVLEPV